jgi:hypothetical protein
MKQWQENDNEDTDVKIAKLILPELLKFKKTRQTRPADIESDEIWEDYLNQMIDSFQQMSKEEYLNSTEEEINKIQKGLDLFAKYLMSIWN